MQIMNTFLVDGCIVNVPDDELDEFLSYIDEADVDCEQIETFEDDSGRTLNVPDSEREDFMASMGGEGRPIRNMRRVLMDDGEVLKLGEEDIRQFVQARRQGMPMSRGMLAQTGIPDWYGKSREEREALADRFGEFYPDEEYVPQSTKDKNLGDAITETVDDVAKSPFVAGVKGAAEGLYEGAVGNPTEAMDDFYGDSILGTALKGANDFANAATKSVLETASAAVGGRDSAAGRAIRDAAERLRTDSAEIGDTGNAVADAVLGFANDFNKNTLPTIAKLAVPGVAATDIANSVVEGYYDAYEQAVNNGASPEKANALASTKAGISALEGLWLAKSAGSKEVVAGIKGLIKGALEMGGKMAVTGGARDLVEQGIEGAENPDLVRAGKAALKSGAEGAAFDIAAKGLHAATESAMGRGEMDAAFDAAGKRINAEKKAAERYEANLSDEARADIENRVNDMVKTGVIPSYRHAQEVERLAAEKLGGRERGESTEAVEQAVMEAAQEVQERLNTTERVTSDALERRQTEAQMRENERLTKVGEQMGEEIANEKPEHAPDDTAANEVVRAEREAEIQRVFDEQYNDWLRRRDEAHKKGGKFTEEPPTKEDVANQMEFDFTEPVSQDESETNRNSAQVDGQTPEKPVEVETKPENRGEVDKNVKDGRGKKEKPTREKLVDDVVREIEIDNSDSEDWARVATESFKEEISVYLTDYELAKLAKLKKASREAEDKNNTSSLTKETVDLIKYEEKLGMNWYGEGYYPARKLEKRGKLHQPSKTPENAPTSVQSETEPTTPAEAAKPVETPSRASNETQEPNSLTKAYSDYVEAAATRLKGGKADFEAANKAAQEVATKMAETDEPLPTDAEIDEIVSRLPEKARETFANSLKQQRDWVAEQRKESETEAQKPDETAETVQNAQNANNGTVSVKRVAGSIKKLTNYKNLIDRLKTIRGASGKLNGEDISVDKIGSKEFFNGGWSRYVRNLIRDNKNEKHKWANDVWRAKISSLSNIKELIESATNERFTPYENFKDTPGHEKTGSKAKLWKGGKYEYDVSISMPDSSGVEKTYSARMIVRSDSKGRKYVYDVVDFDLAAKKASELTATPTEVGAETGVPTGESIAKSENGVNAQSKLTNPKAGGRKPADPIADYRPLLEGSAKGREILAKYEKEAKEDPEWALHQLEFNVETNRPELEAAKSNEKPIAAKTEQVDEQTEAATMPNEQTSIATVAKRLGETAYLPKADIERELWKAKKNAEKDPRAAQRAADIEAMIAYREKQNPTDPNAEESAGGKKWNGGELYDKSNDGEDLSMRRLDPKLRTDPKAIEWAKKKGFSVVDGKITPEARRAYDEDVTKKTAAAAKRWFPDMKIVQHKHGENIEHGQEVIDLRDTSGNTLGWFNPSNKEVHLLPGANAETVAHEIMWHGTRDWATREAAKGNADAQRILDLMHDVERNVPDALKNKVTRLYRANGVTSADVLFNEWGAWFTMGKGGKELESVMETADGRKWYSKALNAVKEVYKDYAANHGGNRADLAEIDGMTRDQFVDWLSKNFAGGKTLGEIGAPKNTTLSTDETITQKARRVAYDSVAPVRDLEREIEKNTGVKIKAEDSVDAALALRPGEHEAVAINQQRQLREVKDMLKKFGLSSEDLGYYMALKAAPGRDAKIDAKNLAKIEAETEAEVRKEWGSKKIERDKAGFKAEVERRFNEKKSGYTSTNGSAVDPREVAKMVPEIENGSKSIEYGAARDKIREIQEDTMDALVDAGLISKADAAKLRKEEPDYVPFKSEFDEKTGEFVGRAYNNLAEKTFYEAKGRQSSAGDILAHILNDNAMAHNKAIENKAREKLAKLVEAHPELGTVSALGNRNLTEARHNKGGNDNVILFKREGKTYAIELNGSRGKAVAAAFTGANQARTWGWVQKGARVWAATATELSPTFAIRNVTKDNIELAENVIKEMGYVKGTKFIAKYGVNQVKSSAALAKYVTTGKIDTSSTTGKLLQEFIDAGGMIGGYGTEGYTDISRALSSEQIAKEMKRGTSMAKAVANHTLHSIGYLNKMSEMTSRFNAYRTQREMGMSAKEAALWSRRTLTDFNRKGDMTGVTNVLRMFSNSTLGATAKAASGLATSKGGIALSAGLLANGAAQALIEHMSNADADEKNRKLGKGTGKDVSEYDRKSSFWLYRNGETGKIVKVGAHKGPFQLINYVGNCAMRVALGDMTAKDMAKELGMSAVELASAFSGLGEVNIDSQEDGVNGAFMAFLSSIAPSIIQAPVEFLTNTDYAGRKVYTEKGPSETKPYYLRARKNTPEWAKNASEWMNRVTGGNEARSGDVDVPAEVIQKVVESFGKNAAKDVITAYETGKAIINGNYGELETRMVPVKRDFVRDAPDSTSRYFNAKRDFEKDAAEFKGLRGSMSKSEQNEYLDSHPWVRKMDSINRAIEMIDELRKYENGFVKDGRSYRKRSDEPPKELVEKWKAKRLELQAKILELMGS